MQLLIEGCKRNDRESQRLLYQHYYGYAMSICARYSRSWDEAREIVNDGFMKIFQKIDQHQQESSFKGWVRKVMINTSIDHYRKEFKNYKNESVREMNGGVLDNPVLNDLSYNELYELIQQLSPGYRAVFNLYAIDGFTHEEIALILNISPGTSKSNLLKARAHLQKMIEKIKKVEDLQKKYV